MLDYLMWNYGREIVTLFVTVIFGGLGLACKKIYKAYVTDKTKEAIAKTAAKCVEQVWKTIHGPEKLKKALEYAETMLSKKGIPFDAEEMEILIEAAVAEFNKAFEKEVDTQEKVE